MLALLSSQPVTSDGPLPNGRKEEVCLQNSSTVLEKQCDVEQHFFKVVGNNLIVVKKVASF